MAQSVIGVHGAQHRFEPAEIGVQPNGMRTTSLWWPRSSALPWPTHRVPRRAATTAETSAGQRSWGAEVVEDPALYPQADGRVVECSRSEEAMPPRTIRTWPMVATESAWAGLAGRQ